MENDVLASLEEERLKVKKQLNLFTIGIFLLLILGIACFFAIPFLGIIFMIGAVILLAFVGNIHSKFKKTFKSKLVSKLVLDELGEEAIYKENSGIPIEEINSLKAAKIPDRYHLEDYISATYNNVPYEMCDCTLEEEHVTTDSKGHTTVSYSTYFKGRVIKIDYQRNLNIELKVVNGGPSGFSASGLQKFETEVIEFNKRFKCYVDEKEHGFYILTPVMISKMLELERMFSGGIAYLFLHNNLYVLINNHGDSLEVNISKPIDGKQIERIRGDILLGATIINEFNLDKDKFNVNLK